MKLLLDKGADPNKKQGSGSALAEAVQKGLSDVVSLLLDAKADPNEKTPDGERLLIYTINNNLPENAKKLIDHGADVTIKTVKGVSILTLAKTSGLVDIVEALAAKGAKDVSLLTYTVGAKTEGVTVPKKLENNTLTIGAHQNFPDPQVTFNLDGKAKSFKASFASGRQDFDSDYNVKLIVEGDGKKLYESDYPSIKSAPQSIDLDVSGVQKLTFRLQADKLFSVVESKGILQNPIIYLP
ncbi:MAG: ankyrin repeat domain-containing protein [Paenibacillaceae bacterium]|nr:ankyrin repeat domain-containing protein [Paenibacillaceae bacterium]